MKRAVAVSMLAWLVVQSTAARAVEPPPQDDKAACLDASASAQTLRAAHKLVEARGQLRICTRQVCPGIVQKDCSTWLDEVEQSLPTLVLVAKDASGRDLLDVKVTVDGHPFASRLQGEALPIDPGSHAAHFESAGGGAVDQTLLVREGGKNQTITVVLPSGEGSAAPAPTPTPTAPPSEPSSGLGTQRVFGIATAGAGVVGLGLGAVFGLLASSAWNSQRSDCASSTSCADHAAAESQHSTLDTDSTVSTAAFLAGGALLAGGAALFFTGGSAPTDGSGARTGWRLIPRVGRGATGMALQGAF